MFCWYKSYYAFSWAGKNSHSNPMHICKVSENRGASPPQCCFQEMWRNNCTGAGRKGEGGYSQFFCRLLLLWGPNPFQLSSTYTVAIQFWCKVQTFSHFEEVPVTPPSSTAKKIQHKHCWHVCFNAGKLNRIGPPVFSGWERRGTWRELSSF